MKHLFNIVACMLFLSCSTLQANWQTPPVDVSTVADLSLSPQVGVDAGGNAIAVWLAESGTSQTIQAARRLFGQTAWSTPVMLDTQASNNLYAPSLAVDNAGNAVAVWAEQIVGPNTYNVRYAIFDVNTLTWTAAADLDTGSEENTNPVVGVQKLFGTAIVVYQYLNNSGTYSINSITIPLLGVPGSINIIETDLVTKQDPQVGVDDNGNAVAVWTNFNGGIGNDNEIHASSYVLGVWGAPAVISSTVSANMPSIGVDGVGNAIAAWIGYDGFGNSVYTSYLPFGGSWSFVSNISNYTAIGNSYILNGGPKVAIIPTVIGNQADSAFIVWSELNGADINIQGAVSSDGTSWFNATGFPNYGLAFGASTAIDGNGDAVAAWVRLNGEALNIEGANWNPNDFQFENLTQLSNTPVNYQPQIAIDHLGNATVVWTDVAEYIGGIIQSTGFLVVNLSPPTSFNGYVQKVKFATQIDITNVLKWTASADPRVIGYRLTQGSTLLTEVTGQGSFTFVVHNRRKNLPNFYTLVAFDALGNESAPMYLTID